MVVFAGDCTCRFFYGHILAFGMSAELFGEETYLYLCKAVFSSQHSAWFNKKAAQMAAHNAILYPDKVTELTELKKIAD